MLRIVSLVVLLCLSIIGKCSDGQWILLPVIANAPETGLMLGAYAMRLQGQKDENVPENRYAFLVSGTSEGMYTAQFWPSWWFNADQNLNMGVGLKYWPSTYYENGNDEPELQEDYEATNEHISLSFDQRLVGEFWLGFEWQLQWAEISSDDDNDLINEDTPGADGGFYTGVGLSLTWDKTDSRDFPTSGHRIKLDSMVYLTALGSAEQYITSEFSAAKYIPVLERSTVAFNMNYMSASEDTPFNMLPAPEGSSILRGTDSTLYSDHELLGLQGEFRWVLTEKWGLDFFSDFAQVAANANNFAVNRFHNATGVGVRFNMAKGTRLNFRVDLALLDGDGFGSVVSFQEAF